jgi:hypothetical protein
MAVRPEIELVLELISDELRPASFIIDNDLYGKWHVHRVYGNHAPQSLIRHTYFWEVTIKYEAGMVRVLADWIGLKEFSLADPEFGANLRCFIDSSWNKHLSEVKLNGLQSQG